MTRRSFLLAPAFLAQAGQPRAFPGWPPEYVDKLLTDSPWAKSIVLPYIIGRAVRTELNLTVRFSSALPIRRALALAEHGREDAAAAVGAPPDRYIVEIGGFLATAVKQGAEGLERDFARTARLSVRGRGMLSPVEVVVPGHGMHLAARLVFPRYPDLAPGEGAIELYAESHPFVIRQAFKLPAMVYEGALEL